MIEIREDGLFIPLNSVVVLDVLKYAATMLDYKRAKEAAHDVRNRLIPALCEKLGAPLPPEYHVEQ